ncbi:PAS domain-containing protein, partial [Alkalilacustris brevis]|uniref:PAS domain-containing protein n=1 Tax=Alkalilacustris brevis TaxID=2026338 RepID=UPI000E0D3991
MNDHDISGRITTHPDDLPPRADGGGAGLAALSRDFDRLVEAQRMVVEINNSLLRSPRGMLDAAIDRALARTGQMAGSDRTYVFRLRPPDRLDNTHEWVADGIEPMIAHLQDMPADLMDDWMPDFERDHPVYIPDVDALPADSVVKDVLAMQGIRSLLAVPMMREGQVAGFVGYDAVREHRAFLPAEIELVRSVANVIGVVLERRDAELAAEAANARLHEERNRLQATLAAMPDLVLELDAAGRFTGYHVGALHDLAMPPEVFLSRTPEEVFSPELAGKAREVMAEVDRSRRSVHTEYPLELDGVRRWYQLSAAPRQGEGEERGYVFVIREITEARQQQKLLRRLGEVSKRTSNLVIVTDRDDRIEWINPAFEARSGWTLDEVAGKRPGEFLAVSDVDASERARIRAAIKSGTPVRAELLNRSRDGAEYWISADIQPLKDEQGRLYGFIAVQTDITRQREDARRLKAAAAEAEAARQRLFGAVEALNHGFAVFDADDRLVLCNRHFEECHGDVGPKIEPGMTYEEILRCRLSRGIYLRAHGREEDWLAERLTRGSDGPLSFEEELRDGRWLRVVDVAIPDGGHVVLKEDITLRKEAEQRAVRDRAMAMEATHDGIAITDSEGRYLYMNASHRRTFGIGADEDVTGLSWQDLYPEDKLDWVVRNVLPVLLEKGSWRGPLMAYRRDGRAIEQEVSLTLNEDGGIICITRDNTEQNRLQRERARLRDELQLALRKGAISQVLSDLTHDFNNLMAIALGSLSMLEDRLSGEDAVSEDVKRLGSALQAATDLFDGLGALRETESRQSLCDLQEILSEAGQMLTNRLLPEQHLVLELDHALPAFYANRSEITQVVLNLLTNARDALGEGAATITLEAGSAREFHPPREPDIGSYRTTSDHMLIRIKDTGKGVPEEVRNRIFQRHFTTKGVAGTGLGLSIVAGILRRNGAAMWFDSQPGEGTTVTILWPAEGAPPQTRSKTLGETGLTDLQGLHVLVVDDVLDVAEILSSMLEVEGAIAMALSDPGEALEAVGEAPGLWNAVVTDFDMPLMSGADLAGKLREIVSNLPIIAVS